MIDSTSSDVSGVRTWLSSDELVRASQFRTEQMQHFFIICRAKLREVIARYTNVTPSAVCFGRSAHGKLYVHQPQTYPSLQFNLTHSNNWMLLACTRGAPVGVDIERIRAMRGLDLHQMAARFFTPDEYADLQQTPEPLRLERFYRLWTCKEAYTKACGYGLSRSLKEFSVTLGPDAQHPSISTRGNGGGAWTLRVVDPCQGYVGACVVGGQLQQYTLFAS